MEFLHFLLLGRIDFVLRIIVSIGTTPQANLTYAGLNRFVSSSISAYNLWLKIPTLQ